MWLSELFPSSLVASEPHCSGIYPLTDFQTKSRRWDHWLEVKVSITGHTDKASFLLSVSSRKRLISWWERKVSCLETRVVPPSLPHSLTSLHLTGHLIHVYEIWMSLFLCSLFALQRHSQTLSNPFEIKPARAGLLLRWHTSPQWFQHSHWQSRGAFSEACPQCFCGEALPGRQQCPFSINDLFWWTLMFWVNYTLVPFSLFPHEAITWQQFLPAAGWTLWVCHLCRFLLIPSNRG